MEDKGESKFRNVMERYWYALFIIAVALAAAVIGFICEAWKMQEGFLYRFVNVYYKYDYCIFLVYVNLSVTYEKNLCPEYSRRDKTSFGSSATTSEGRVSK